MDTASHNQFPPDQTQGYHIVPAAVKPSMTRKTCPAGSMEAQRLVFCTGPLNVHGPAFSLSTRPPFIPVWSDAVSLSPPSAHTISAQVTAQYQRGPIGTMPSHERGSCRTWHLRLVSAQEGLFERPRSPGPRSPRPAGCQPRQHCSQQSCTP